MRIAIVRTPEAGSTCGSGLVASALAAAGHHVGIHTDRPADPELVAPAGGAGTLRIDDLRDDCDLCDDCDLRDALTAAWSDAPPDVVHAVGPTAARAAAATGLPVVLALPVGTPGPGSGGTAGAAPDVTRVLASSEDQHTALLRHGVPRARLRTVPACVDTDAFTPHGPALRRGDHPRLVVLGPLAPGAGAGTAIRALAGVRAAELLVAGGTEGEDPDRQRLFRVAREAGVADRVRFLGPVGATAVPRLLRSADVVVAAAGYDVPVAPVLQTMACSRPVVASAVGGLRDAVVDRVTGVHVRPGRPDEVSVALRGLLADDAMRTGYGIAGRDRAVSRFDRARIAEALGEVYAEAVVELPGAATAAEGPGSREPVAAG